MDPSGILPILRLKALTVDEAEHIKAGRTLQEKVERLIDTLKLTDDAAFQEFLDVLVERKQEANARLIPIAGQLMTSEHKQQLNTNIYELVQSVDPDGVVTILRQRVLTQRDVERIKAGETRQEKVERLIDTLVLKDDAAFHAFLEALVTTGQVAHARLVQTTDVSETTNIQIQPHKDHTRINHEQLLDMIEPRFGLIQTLLNIGVLTRRESDKIIYQQTVSEKNAKLLEMIREKNTLSDFEGFKTSLVKTGQEHIVNYMDNNTGSKCRSLSEDEISRFNRNKLWLMNHIDTTVLIDYLFDEKCINNWMRESIKAEGVKHKQNELLLDILSRKSYADLEKMRLCLHSTRQSHVAEVLTNDGVPILVHANMEDNAIEEEVVSRWVELIAIGKSRSKRFSEAKKIRRIENRLKQKGLRIINCEIRDTMRVWMLCCADESVRILEEMLYDGNLCGILVKLFTALLRRKISKLQIFSHDLKAENYVGDIGVFAKKKKVPTATLR